MFVLRNIEILFNILLRINSISYDTYVYLEDSEEFVNFHLRNWNRWSENSVTNQDVVNVLVHGFSDEKELNFLAELWATFMDVSGIT